MASKTTLNAKNLEALGSARLAELLIEISEGNANAKRRLRLELAGSESPDKLANEIRKRLSAIATATANVGWRTLKGFRGDLNTQRRLIVEQVLTAAPSEAADLVWQFISLGDAVIERTSDASGGVIEIFRQACRDAAFILSSSKSAPDISRIVDTLLANAYGQTDELVALLAPLMDRPLLEQLRSSLIAASKEVETFSSAKPRPVKRWRKRVLATTEFLRKRTREDALKVALLAIADALGDVDAYIALMADAYLPATAARIAQRLLNADRAADALKALDAARHSPRLAVPGEWVETRICALETLGRKTDAQALRLDRFRQTLEAEYLRAYLKRLPDFEDVEAEDKTLDWVKDFPDANAALELLIRWPSLERAAAMVTQRVTEMNGNEAEALTFAADRLSSRYPFAALVLHRQIVEAGLLSMRETVHSSAVMPYLEAESLARHINDVGRFESHQDWHNRLTKTFGHRTAFWKAIP